VLRPCCMASAATQHGAGGACPGWDTWGQPLAPATTGLGSPLTLRASDRDGAHPTGLGTALGSGSLHGAGDCTRGRGHSKGWGLLWGWGSPHGAGDCTRSRGHPMGLGTALRMGVTVRAGDCSGHSSPPWAGHCSADGVLPCGCPVGLPVGLRAPPSPCC